MRGIEVAECKLGLQEVKDRKKLMEFFKQYLIPGQEMLDPSTTPWCARFVGCCERAVGNKGTGRDNARSYLLYGTKVSLDQAREGDIAVFTRGNSNWQGHVAYVVSHTSTDLTVLGGNQRDCVCKSVYSTEHLLSIRRPPNAVS